LPLLVPLKINTIDRTTRRAWNYNGDALAEFLNRPASCLNSAINEFYLKKAKFIKTPINLVNTAALNIIGGCEKPYSKLALIALRQCLSL
jgi:iron uptake system EfeUOB component EfeO/EfeM